MIVPQVDARLWVPFHRTHYPHHLTRTIFDEPAPATTVRQAPLPG